MTKAAELREMSDDQLALTLKEGAENLFKMRIKSQTERLDTPSELRKVRRTIARVKTILTERVQAKDASAANSATGANSAAGAKGATGANKGK